MTLSLLGLLFWALFGLAIAGCGGLLLLFALGRLRVLQHAYDDAPQTHRRKTGTPTMGGIVFVLALVAALGAARGALLAELVALVVLCAGVGAIDDVIKVRGGANRGLPARTKLLATALVATLFLRAIDGEMLLTRDVLFHAGSFSISAPHWLWFLLGVLAVTGTVHAVNLTDGLDGLAAGTMIPPLAVFALVGAAAGVPAVAIAASVGVGACAAFLIYNRHPAQLFMGDTGSLALGALLSGVAILSGEMLLLLVVGAVFVAEALSVILQVSYFKASGGKRIFRMSPLHHHFE
ncbi:MAG: phospho-N-acetylmuramoyl-pentapeptide-transferase, partial [Candidatus Eremiobacteraeota bacterium]|nr:phospho-N-acetylmuramoyl-pentapeptide-transferase [Candidatus Eremiobacteraeota bacterium]